MGSAASPAAAVPPNPMRKKIDVRRLRPGMYVDGWCGTWMSHPFWRTRFLLADEAELAEIHASGVSECWIDTTKGLDPDAVAPPPQPPAEPRPGSSVAPPPPPPTAPAAPDGRRHRSRRNCSAPSRCSTPRAPP